MNKHVVAVAASVFTKLGDGDTLLVDSINGCTRALSDLSVGGSARLETFSLLEDDSVGTASLGLVRLTNCLQRVRTAPRQCLA